MVPYGMAREGKCWTLCGQRSCSDNLKSHPRAAISRPAKKAMGSKELAMDKKTRISSLFSAIVPFYGEYNFRAN